ncbi:hypothetical protein BDB01DRAFT_796650 [Pilobolus umbonatus]|nr:hypothetical protein BDB01DRAFT_796650 [Pilobolus umbonatus]
MSVTHSLSLQPSNHVDLPLEIAEIIASYLTARQKGTCLTVSKSWNRLFIPPQYSYICLRTRQQFERFYYHALQSNYLGYYVKYLCLEGVSMNDSELASLPSLCPYLTALSLEGNGIDLMKKSSALIGSAHFLPWSCIRQLKEGQDLIITSYLLASHSPSHLTSLSITFNKCFDTLQLVTKDIFLSSLNNLYQLINLSLDSIQLSVTDMEIIHNACPHLKILGLTNASLIPGTLNSLIQPAQLINTFKLKHCSGLFNNIEWLYYISSKYIYMEHLELWSDEVYQDMSPLKDEIEERSRALNHLIMKSVRLKSIQLFNICMDELLFQTMDDSNIELEHIGLGDMSDNTMNLLYALGESQQNVSSLTLWGWPSLCIPDTMEEMIEVVNSCSNQLTSFTFSMFYSGISCIPFSLKSVFENCFHLHYLQLDAVQPVTPTDYVMSNPHPLKHIVLKYGSFMNNMLNYLVQKCPSLSTLEIDTCTLVGHRRQEMALGIDMSRHRFDTIIINHLSPFYDPRTRLRTDIRYFRVLQSSKEEHIYELTGYEYYTDGISFDHLQRPLKQTRPTQYKLLDREQDNLHLSNHCLLLQCQAIRQLHLGGFWVI